jgi:kumamolisin
MYSINIPSDSTIVQELLAKNNVSFETISSNSLTVNELTEDLINEIKTYDNVYILENDNILFKNYTSFVKHIGKPIKQKITAKQMKKRIFRPNGGSNINRTQSLYYNINDLKKIYNMPIVNNPNRVKIGVIQLGGGYNTSDLNAYWTYLGLTTKPIINTISVDGARNSPGSNSDFEVVLDIEILGGMCPNSTINVYFAQNSTNSFYNAISRAISDNNKVISISWGAAEKYFSNSSLSAYSSLMSSAANLGITICVASGDNGYKDDGSQIGIDFPSSSPYALAVGGTTLTAPNNIYTSETAWSGSGGGISSFFAKPSYQSAITNSLTKRCTPDVCANADPNTGYIIYLRNTFYVIGGTSAAAPLWAGFLAYINYNGFLNSRIYSLSSSLNDIINGTNGYSATLRYDLCTGLGSPNFSKIKTALGL